MGDFAHEAGVVSRASRFDKLEGERGEEAQPVTGASLERFGAEPELGTRGPAVDAAAPALNAERLKRFDADGADGLGLDRDPLAALPMLECPACLTSCGKFEPRCHACRVSLTDEAARVHNLRRLEAMNQGQAALAETARLKHEEENDAASVRWLEKQRVEAVALNPPRQKTWAPWVYGGVVLCVLFGAFAGSLRAKVFAGLLVLGLLATRMTRETWLRLGEQVRRRGQ